MPADEYEQRKMEHLTRTSNLCIRPVHGLNGQSQEVYIIKMANFCQMTQHLNILQSTASFDCLYQRRAFALPL